MDAPDPPLPDSLPDDLADEITSINAIYGPDTLSVHSPPAPSSEQATTLLLAPPASHPLYPTALLMTFPQAYPGSPARILGPFTSDPSLGKGAGHAAAQQAQTVLEAVSVPDEPVVFALLAELETQLGSLSRPAAPAVPNDRQDPERRSSSPSPQPRHDSRFDLAAWTTAEPLESHRSVFIGRAIAVSSAADVTAATTALLEQDRRVARATHNIRAWRYRSEPTSSTAGITGAKRIEHQESDDDGETRAGAKVLEILNAMGVWDVLVVVSRWYGGVKLGPERFRLIGQCARDVLVLGGWDSRVDEKEVRKKGK